MKQNSKFFTYAMLGATALLSACGGSSDGGDEATPLADAIGLIAESVETTGSSLEGARLKSASAASLPNLSILGGPIPFTSTMCDVHGSVSGYSMGDVVYPFAQAYCGLTVDAGDTVRGGFSLAQGLICTLEKGGIEFAGATQSITPDFTDTDCWPNGGPGDGDETDGLVLSAVGSEPASFNSYFDKGVDFTTGAMGLHFQIAANLDGDKIEFIAHEDWTSGDSAGNEGVMAGAIDKTTGVLQFEKRDERIRADCTDDSCGWNRHTRIYASLDMVGGEPQDLNSFSYANSDVHVSDPVGAQTDNQGYLVTAQGALAGEIQAKVFYRGGVSTTVAELKDESNWTLQHASNACADSNGIDTTGACGSEMGIDVFQNNTNFALFSAASPTSVDDWLANFGGFNFTAVDTDIDVAYDTK
jgi:hypothetical protein